MPPCPCLLSDDPHERALGRERHRFLAGWNYERQIEADIGVQWARSEPGELTGMLAICEAVAEASRPKVARRHPIHVWRVSDNEA